MNHILRTLPQSNTTSDSWTAGVPIPAAATQGLPGADSASAEFDPSCRDRLSLAAHPRLVTVFDQASLAAERFRLLGSRLRFLQKRHQFKKLVITSTLKGEGKSMISANLALTLARYQRTLLIDGDLRQSGLEELLRSTGLPGLSDWWQGTKDISSLLIQVDGFSLWYLPPGETTEQPLEILQSPRMSQMFAQVAKWFDWIIVDTPPLLLADPHIWTAHADRTLLAVSLEKTPKRLLQKALESAENLRLLGVVANNSTDTAQQYYKQYYKTRTVDRASMVGDGQLFPTPSVRPRSAFQQLEEPKLADGTRGQ